MAVGTGQAPPLGIWAIFCAAAREIVQLWSDSRPRNISWNYFLSVVRYLYTVLRHLRTNPHICTHVGGFQYEWSIVCQLRKPHTPTPDHRGLHTHIHNYLLYQYSTANHWYELQLLYQTRVYKEQVYDRCHQYAVDLTRTL